MKTLLMILLTTVSMYAQKDTIYLTWRGDKFYEVAETISEDGRRTINETPIGDTLQTVEHYVKNADEVFNKLSEAAGLLIQKNAIINGVNSVNKMLTVREVANIIENPTANGIPWFAVIDNDAIIMSNIAPYLNDSSTVVQINRVPEGRQHSSWTLITQGADRIPEYWYQQKF